MQDPTHGQFSEARAKAILARAIELDARDPLTTTEDLREIAAEIGVSPAAVDIAIREQHALEQRTIGSQLAANRIAALGLPLGVAAGVALMTASAYPGILVFKGIMSVGLFAAGGLLVAQGAKTSLRSFHLRNALLWAGVTAGSLAGIALVGGPTTVELPWLFGIGSSIGHWFTSSILGSAAVLSIRRIRDGSSRDADPRDGVSPATAPHGGRVRRAIRWLSVRIGSGTSSTRRIRVSVSRPQQAQNSA